MIERAETRLVLVLPLVLLLGILLLACRDEATPGDLETDAAEEVPAGAGETVRWYGLPNGLETIHQRRIDYMRGGKIHVRSGLSDSKLYGTYKTTIRWELQPDGRRLNEIKFWPVGASDR